MILLINSLGFVKVYSLHAVSCKTLRETCLTRGVVRGSCCSWGLPVVFYKTAGPGDIGHVVAGCGDRVSHVEGRW